MEPRIDERMFLKLGDKPPFLRSGKPNPINDRQRFLCGKLREPTNFIIGHRFA